MAGGRRTDWGLVPTYALARCAMLFQQGLTSLHRMPGGAVRPATVAAVQNLLECLVLCEHVAIKDPTLWLNDDFVTSVVGELWLDWLRPADRVLKRVPVSLDEERELFIQAAWPLVHELGPPTAQQRAAEAFVPADGKGANQARVLRYLANLLGGFGRDVGDLSHALHEMACTGRGEFRGWRHKPATRSAGDPETLRQAFITASFELLELALARAACDRRGMVLWALPESEYAHWLCLADSRLSQAALQHLRLSIGELRKVLLDGPSWPPFCSAGANLHCNVYLAPVLLAVLRNSHTPTDLVTTALQMRDAAAPLRTHLSALDSAVSGDALGLADWRHELQSVCDAVGRALGLVSTSAPGNVASAVVKARGGDPTDLISALAERAPAALRRRLLHPLYLNRGRAFLRQLTYDAVLAPEVDAKLRRLFGEIGKAPMLLPLRMARRRK